jgi:hypothetical protein
MRFAKVVFRVAGVYGLIVLAPQYFLEEKTGRDFPPPITHPEFYYGFIGVTLAWQVLFLVLSRNPIRYRPLMIPPILAKTSFVFAVTVLFFQNRVSPFMLGAVLFDLVFAALFVVAYLKTPKDHELVT